MKNRIIHIIVSQRKYRDPDYNATRLAAELGVSPSALSRLLKKEFGKSYTGMIYELRVHDAIRFLTGKQKRRYSIDDIGVLVGFSNRTSFYEAFRKLTGTTPEQYRHTKQNENNN